MSTIPLISIITVVYNGEQFIEKTIKSVLSQSYKNYEYIIIDGGSTDNTLKIINKYRSHIDKIISEPDHGIYDAMNKGIKICTGKYIGMINASDWYEPDALVRVAEIANKDPDVICSDLYTYDQSKHKTKLLKSYPSFSVLFWFEMRVFHPTMFVKKTLYKKFTYDTSYKIVSDLKIILQLMKSGYKFVLSVVPLATYSLGGTSSSGMKILKEEVRMKREIGFSWLVIYLSSVTKATVMAWRFVEARLFNL